MLNDRVHSENSTANRIWPPTRNDETDSPAPNRSTFDDDAAASAGNSTAATVNTLTAYRSSAGAGLQHDVGSGRR